MAFVDDRSIVGAQIGREPRAFLRVAARCPFGFPAVTEQKPYDDEGKPFPTGFYLTCPELVAASLDWRRRAGWSAGASGCERAAACAGASGAPAASSVACVQSPHDRPIGCWTAAPRSIWASAAQE